jgi:hypothetical protein
MRRWYLLVFVELFLGLLPILTGLMWLVYVLWWKQRAHWGDAKGFHLFISFPAMFSVGIVPFVLSQMWLMNVWGPRFERASWWTRQLLEFLPPLLWAVTTVALFILFVRLQAPGTMMKLW